MILCAFCIEIMMKPFNLEHSEKTSKISVTAGRRHFRHRPYFKSTFIRLQTDCDFTWFPVKSPLDLGGPNSPRYPLYDQIVLERRVDCGLSVHLEGILTGTEDPAAPQLLVEQKAGPQGSDLEDPTNLCGGSARVVQVRYSQDTLDDKVVERVKQCV